IANQGLDTIIAYSVPALVFIYPITIILVLLTLSQNVFNWTTAIYRGAVLFTALVSLYDGLKEFGYSLPTITPFMYKLPLAHVGLGWLFPSIVGAVIGESLVTCIKRNEVSFRGMIDHGMKLPLHKLLFNLRQWTTLQSILPATSNA